MMIEQENEQLITLKALREAADISQVAISKRVGVSKSNYQSWEYGQAIPKFDNAIALARELNVSLKTLAKSMGMDVTGIPDDNSHDTQTL